MKTLFFITALQIVLLSSCASKNDDDTIAFTKIQNAPVEKSLIGNYKSKPAKELFLPELYLNLNADSTYSYALVSCLGTDSSSGRWHYANDSITLITFNSVKEKALNTQPFERTGYSDLTNQTFSVTAAYLIKASPDPDTLIRQ